MQVGSKLEKLAALRKVQEMNETVQHDERADYGREHVTPSSVGARRVGGLSGTASLR
jgi:hypothetical protein